MTSEPRAWERPDGTLVDSRGGHELLRTGRKVGRTIYVQHGLEPADDDPLIGVMDTEALASRVVDAVNGAALHTVQELNEAREQGMAEGREQGSAAVPVAREDTASPDEASRAVACPDCGADVGVLDAVPSLLPVIDDHEWLGVLCSGSGTTLDRPVPAQPAEAPVVQRAAPTQDLDAVERALVGELSVAFEAGRNWAPGGAAWDTQNHARRIAARLTSGVLRGGGADGGGEDEDPNLAHRSAVDAAKLSGPETRSLLLCTRDGRVGGAATIGDSRLNASIVWGMLGNGGTPDDVHRSYPWCSVEDAAVLDRLRLDVVEHLDEEEDVDPVADYDANAGPCPRCGHEIDLRTVCHVCHRLPSFLHEAKARTELPEPSGQCDVCSAPLYNLCAPLPDGGKACSARCVDLHRLARAAGVSPDSEDPVGAIEAAIRARREPERMLGRDAEKLPRGSWVTHHADFDGGRAFPRMKTATEGWQPENVTNGLVGHQDYVVLHRAPAPTPAPLTVGDEVKTPEQLAALPEHTVLRDASFDVCERMHDRWKCFTGTDHVDLPARILDLPGGEEA